MNGKVTALIVLLLSWPLPAFAASPWIVTAEGDVEFLGVGENKSAMSGELFASVGSDAAVHVFERDGDDWDEIDRLQAPEGDAGEGFGYALEMQGDIIAVTAPERSVNGMASAGIVYVFRRGSGNDWQLVQRLTAADASEDARFGHGVDIDGNNIVVSAFRPGSELGEPPEGAIYVFAYDEPSDNWLERAKLEPPPEFLPTVYGPEFDVSGDTMAVGMSREDVVLVYENTGRGWQETHRLGADMEPRPDSLGNAVGIEGDTLVAAAYRESVEGEGDPGGRVYVFERDGEDWQMTTELRSPDTEGFQFGTGMEFGAGLIAVTKQRDNVAYLFGRDDAGGWQHLANIDDPDLHPDALSANFSVHDITREYLLVSGDGPSIVVYRRSDLLPGEDGAGDDDLADDSGDDSGNGSDDGSDDDTGNDSNDDAGGNTADDDADNNDDTSGDGSDDEDTAGSGAGQGVAGAGEDGDDDSGGGVMAWWVLLLLPLARRLRGARV